MNYPEAIQFLYGLRLFGAKFGLENTLKLAALAGSPQAQLRFIHVAGTNGRIWFRSANGFKSTGG